jgi:hypothetical protein
MTPNFSLLHDLKLPERQATEMDEHQPGTTTIPTEPTTTTPPAPSAQPNKPPPRLTSTQKLRILLYRSLTTADRNVVRLSKLLSSPSGTDTLLCTTSYTLTLLRALLSRLLERFRNRRESRWHLTPRRDAHCLSARAHQHKSPSPDRG